MGVPLLEIRIRVHCFFRIASVIFWLRVFIYRTNRYRDRGSPCLSPLWRCERSQWLSIPTHRQWNVRDTIHYEVPEVRREGCRFEHPFKEIPIHPIVGFLPIQSLHPFLLYTVWSISCATITLSMVSLPDIKLAWVVPVIFSMIGLMRLARIFKTTFTITMQREIGLNWESVSGDSDFGMRHMRSPIHSVKEFTLSYDFFDKLYHWRSYIVSVFLIKARWTSIRFRSFIGTHLEDGFLNLLSGHRCIQPSFILLGHWGKSQSSTSESGHGPFLYSRS